MAHPDPHPGEHQHSVIAGCMVTEGYIEKNSKLTVKRGSKELCTCSIDSLKHYKENIETAKHGTECGIGLSNGINLQEGDVLEASIEQIISAEEA